MDAADQAALHRTMRGIDHSTRRRNLPGRRTVPMTHLHGQETVSRPACHDPVAPGQPKAA